MSSLAKSLMYNLSGQMVARVISFSINMYLLRIVDNDVLGLVNVRLTLLYNTVLFLTREPLRKANLHSSTTPQYINTLWLAPLICAAVSSVCLCVWQFFSSSLVPLPVLLSFPLSALLESFAEPFAALSLRLSLATHFAIAQCLLNVMPRLIVFALILARLDAVGSHIEMFAVAQVSASLVYLLYHIVQFHRMSARRQPELAPVAASFRELLPQPSHGLSRASLCALLTLFGHSVLKQAVTDGSGYVMTFTHMFTLKQQAVYDAVVKLGSLVARIVFAPLEETCFAYFSNHIRSGEKEQSAEKTKRKSETNDLLAGDRVFGTNTDSHDSLVSTFSSVLHVATTVGLVVCAFGVPYSPLAVWIYGGELLYANGGAALLSYYSVYLFIMAVNGITEAFAFASMNNNEVFSHGSFMLVSAVGHVSLSVFLVRALHSSAGFIVADAVNMLVRIAYSWRHIGSYLGKKTPSILSILPPFSTLVFIAFSTAAALFSLLLFGSEAGMFHSVAHVAVGAVLLGLLSLHIAQHDHVFARLVQDGYKKTQ